MKYLVHLIMCVGLLSCSVDDDSNFEVETSEELITHFSIAEISDYLAVSPIDIPDGTLFYQNVPYGNHPNQVVDIFMPNIDITLGGMKKNKVVLNIHGGGFVSGSKDDIYQNSNDIFSYLENNLAFISMNYRFIEDDNPDYKGVLKCFKDSKRVLNFIKYLNKSKTLKLNHKNIYLKGSSSGAGIAQYLISKPKYRNRIKGASLNAPQATYDFLSFDNLFNEFNFHLYDYVSAHNLENKTINFYGGSDIQQLENDMMIVENRAKVSLSQTFANYTGRLRVVAGNKGVPYSTLTNLNQILHHQIHAIEIFNSASNSGVYIDAEIPHMNLVNTQTELDFILDTFN